MKVFINVDGAREWCGCLVRPTLRQSKIYLRIESPTVPPKKRETIQEAYDIFMIILQSLKQNGLIHNPNNVEIQFLEASRYKLQHL